MAHIPSSISKAKPPRQPNRKIDFTLPDDHADKDSKEWRRRPCRRSRERPTSFVKQFCQRANLKLAKNTRLRHEAALVFASKLKARCAGWHYFLSSMGYCCHLQCRKSWRPIYSNGLDFQQSFPVADGHITPASNIVKLHHPVCEPAFTVDMVPALADLSLLSGNKFTKAGYISIWDGEEVNIYDGRTVKIVVS